MHGRSHLRSWCSGVAPDGPRTQYFEMQGHRGIYHDGWKAVTQHEAGQPFPEDTWELYHLAEDFAELSDLSAEEPERLADLQARWWHEAGRFGVTQLDDRFLARAQNRAGDAPERPNASTYSRGPPHNGKQDGRDKR